MLTFKSKTVPGRRFDSCRRTYMVDKSGPSKNFVIYIYMFILYLKFKLSNQNILFLPRAKYPPFKNIFNPPPSTPPNFEHAKQSIIRISIYPSIFTALDILCGCHKCARNFFNFQKKKRLLVQINLHFAYQLI